MINCPAPCPRCKYPLEYGTFGPEGVCKACDAEENGMPRDKANRYRYVRPEYKMYPNDSGEGRKIPKNQDAWNAYFDFGGHN